MDSSQFNDIVPRTRAERAAMRDKERIEVTRLKERSGGYHKFVDSAEVHNPDPISTHFISGKSMFVTDQCLMIAYRTREVRQGLRSGRLKGPPTEVPASTRPLRLSARTKSQQRDGKVWEDGVGGRTCWAGAVGQDRLL